VNTYIYQLDIEKYEITGNHKKFGILEQSQKAYVHVAAVAHEIQRK
jgi:hypothetical protein